jgi:hypothetical protein
MNTAAARPNRRRCSRADWYHGTRSITIIGRDPTNAFTTWPDASVLNATRSLPNSSRYSHDPAGTKLRLESAFRETVACRHVGAERSGYRLMDTRVLHRERDQNALFDVVLPRNPGYTLHDISGQGGRVIGVGREDPWRPNTTWDVARQPGADRTHLIRIVCQYVAAVVLESGRVRHHVAQCDWVGVRRGILKSR